MTRSSFVLVTAAAGVLALAIALLTPQSWRLQMYLDNSVWWALLTLSGLLVTALVAAVRHWRECGQERRHDLLSDLCATLLLSAAVVVLVPGRALIENDENNLILSAQSIHNHFSPVSPGTGVIDMEGVLTPTRLSLDKRGVMFPLMLNALAPWALDYPAAALWLNAIFGWLGLFVLVRIARRFMAGPAALAAPVLLVSFPMFTVTLRSGGFDLANFALLLLAVHLTCGLLYQASRVRLALLVATLAVLCQLRYETPLVASLLLGALMLRAWGHAASRSWLLAAAALALAPALFRMAAPFDWEMPAPWFKPWTSANVPDNLERLAAWAFSPAGWEMGNPAVGAVCLLAALLYLIGSRRPLRQLWAFSVCVAPAALLTGVLMFSYWGQITTGITTRYFIYLAALVSIFAAFALHAFFAQLAVARAGLASLLIAMLWLTLDLQRSVVAAPWVRQTPWNFRDSVRAVVQAQYGECNVVVGLETPPLLLTRGVSAVFPIEALALAQPDAPRLQRAGIVAVALAFETSEEKPDIDPQLLERIPQAIRLGAARRGSTTATLFQLYPAQHIDRTQCQPRQPVWTALRWDPEAPPVRRWEHFRDRAEESNARLMKVLQAPPGAPGP